PRRVPGAPRERALRCGQDVRPRPGRPPRRRPAPAGPGGAGPRPAVPRGAAHARPAPPRRGRALRRLRDAGPHPRRRAGVAAGPQARVVLAWARRGQGGPEVDSAWKAVLALAPSYQSLVTPDSGRRFERILPAELLLDLDSGGRTEAEVAAGLVGKAQRLFRAGDLAGALAELTRAAY